MQIGQQMSPDTASEAAKATQDCVASMHVQVLLDVQLSLSNSLKSTSCS